MNHRLTHWIATLAVVLSLSGTIAIQAVSAQESVQGHGQATPEANGWQVLDQQAIEVEGTPIALSPDGKWLAGPGKDDDFCVWEVETLDPACDGSQLPVDLTSIAWSPDSSAVAFSLDTPRLLVDSDIYVFEVESGKVVDLTDDDLNGNLSLSGSDPASGPINLDIMPAWSPDGRHLAFARSDWNSDLRGTALMTVSRDGGEAETLLTLPPPTPLIVYTPMYWLSDDSLLFSVQRPDPDDGQNGIWKRTASGKLTQIFSGNADDGIPGAIITSVTPDGLFATVTSGLRAAQFITAEDDGDIFFLVDLTTGEAAPIPVVDEQDGSSVTIPGKISPDGDTVTYGVRDGNGFTSVVIIGSEGDVGTEIPLDEEPSWVVQMRGIDFAAGNIAFVPTGTGGTGILFWLAPPANEGTPVPPCSCVQPPEDGDASAPDRIRR